MKNAQKPTTFLSFVPRFNSVWVFMVLRYRDKKVVVSVRFRTPLPDVSLGYKGYNQLKGITIRVLWDEFMEILRFHFKIV
jgi:hypothetical protein